MKLVITWHDVLIMESVGRRKCNMVEIADVTDTEVTNAHNQVASLCAKGFMKDVYREDANRAGLREGEQRRLYEVTPLGRKAIVFFHGVYDSLNQTGDKTKKSPRNMTKKYTGKRTSKKVQAKKKTKN